MQCPTKQSLDERLTFRLTQDEKDRITNLAAAVGLKPSDFVRRSLQAQLELAALVSSGADQ